MSGPHRQRPRTGATLDREPADDVAAAHANLGRTRPQQGRPHAPTRSGSPAVTWLRGFVRRYGWRAYALPVLSIVTVAALMNTTSASAPNNAGAPGLSGSGAAPPPVAGSQIPLKGDTSGTLSNTVLKAASLPAGLSYTRVGDGTFRILPGTSPKVGTGQLFRYSIDVENGVTGVDLAQFQSLIVSTMADKRSWSGHGVAVQRVDSGRIDFHATLTSSMTVRKICGFDIPAETSCYARAGSVAGLDVNRVVFNVARWQRGSTAYLGDLAAYRIYMINHENGHALGHNHAHQCLPGGLAPVMLQQTIGLRSAATGKLCGANPWPYPPGVQGTPGAEQLDTPQNTEYGRGD